ncbi:membrane protease YdiL (CAAX protease family) [Methanolinea mesophila]|uniref:CPBP family intramembrane glutamic endopeptidase n=1 Tax=Methanolinea mesophila TaxID=547055 RepID=UPI001AE5A560|nr:CPBP family intramembrane glutamic endopeptidase [Methanolinea mesophila]MBP1929366.1 membrane protease YdiL (CAAX protease family) [Methanolinea mesophila]
MEVQKPGILPGFIVRHPIGGAVYFLILFLLVGTLGGAVGILVTGSTLTLVAIAEGSAGIVGILFILRLGWVRRAGYATSGRLGDVPLYILPAGIALLSLSEGTVEFSAVTVLYFLAVALVIGVSEETYFRGLMLQSLVSLGMFRTVMISAALFALPHLLNALSGAWDPGFTLADSFAAFGLGVAFAAILFRTGTIWPVVGIHSLTDFTALLSGGTLFVPAQSPIQLATVAGAGLLALMYGLFLIRPGKEIRLHSSVYYET